LSDDSTGTDKEPRQYHSKGYSGIGDHPKSFYLQAFGTRNLPVRNARKYCDLRTPVKFLGR
jgi:hypothetical protein